MKGVALAVTISAALCAALTAACGQDEQPPERPEPPPIADPPDERAPEEPQAETDSPEPQPQPQPQGAMAGTGEDQSDLECEDDDVACPMFDWMEANTKRAVEEGDVEAIAAAFHEIERMTPVAEWDSAEHGDEGWVRLSRRGAELAEEGNLREARKLCKGCHRRWRDAFREQGLRTAPLPELPEDAAEGPTDR